MTERTLNPGWGLAGGPARPQSQRAHAAHARVWCARLARRSLSSTLDARGRAYSGLPPGTNSATLFPLSKIWSSLVIRLPSGVISLRSGARGGLGGHGRAGFVGGGGAAARRGALFGHILEHHVDVVVEAAQRADNLLVAAHNDPHPRADALVDQPARAGRERLGRAQQAMEGRWAGGEAARHSLQREHLAHGRARSSRRDARAESQRGPAGASPGNVRSLPGKPTKPFLAANQTFAVGWSSAPFTEPHAWPRLVGVRHIHRRPPVPFQCILTHRPCSRLSGRQLPAVTRSRY